jgi:hypothetical protein
MRVDSFCHVEMTSGVSTAQLRAGLKVQDLEQHDAWRLRR